MIDKAFGWWRSWISIAAALLVCSGTFIFAGWLANELARAIVKVVCVLLGIGS